MSESARSGNKVTSAILHGETTVTARASTMSEVFIIVGGFESENESICAMQVSRERVEPAHHPDAKRQRAIDPVLRVVMFSFAQGWFASQKAVRSFVFACGDVH